MGGLSRGTTGRGDRKWAVVTWRHAWSLAAIRAGVAKKASSFWFVADREPRLQTAASADGRRGAEAWPNGLTREGGLGFVGRGAVKGGVSDGLGWLSGGLHDASHWEPSAISRSRVAQ